MARTIRNAKIDSRSARAKLAMRREPYWTVISAGCALGYRRGAKGGTWIARFRGADGRQTYESLGAADDARDPDGVSAFSFSQAQERARDFFATMARRQAGDSVHDGPYTVSEAIEDYLVARARRGSKGVRADRYAADARIIPTIGDTDTAKLTARKLRDWHAELAEAPKRLRTKRAAAVAVVRDIDKSDDDAVRARRSTANRVLTIVKAALNHAFQEGRIASDNAWRKVKPFREADTPIVRYLSAAECIRLVNACSGPFRDLVLGALVTGCRYGELARMQVADFNADAGSVAVRISKSGKHRHVALNAEGSRLFASLVAGRAGAERMFRREDGATWGASHQQRPIEDAAEQASIDPAPTFHILRHTYASALALRGVPMRVIADQLGHADTRMTERHYAHLAPSHVASVVRTALPDLGLVEQTNVVGLVTRGGK